MRNRAAGFVLATLLSAVAPSFAQLAVPAPLTKAPATNLPQPDPTAMARERFAEGVRFTKKHEWQKAYDAFLAAWKLKQHPQIALNLGGAEMKIGKHRDASEHLRYCIDNNLPEHPEAVLARKWLEEAKKKVVTLKITVEGTEAEVRIDGQSIGKSPLPPEVYVDPGKHTVEARSGTRRAERTDTYEAGSARELKLLPTEPAGPRPTEVASTATAAVDVAAVERQGPRKDVVIGLGAGAGIALIAGGIFAGVSAAKGAEVDRLQTELITEDGLQRGACAVANKPAGCDELLSAVYEQNAFATASLWSFIGAGALGAATLGYWYFAPRRAPTEAGPVRVGAVVNGTGGKLVLEGRW